MHDVTRWAKGLRAAGSGDSSGALHHLSRFRLPVLARMAAPDRIEAAVRAGETDDCPGLGGGAARRSPRPPVGRGHSPRSPSVGRSRQTRATPKRGSRRRCPSTSGPVARSTPRAPSWPTASGYAAAIAASTPASTCAHALDTFQDVRAEALAARANQELRASGETARKRDPSTLVKLTPTELQIAQLVSSGMSNKDVAAQCWISPRTVAFHLRNVFAKAGVTSRGELARLDLT